MSDTAHRYSETPKGKNCGSILGKDKAMTKEGSTIVFVVDDERIIAETLAAILRIEGYASFPFVNPLHALEAAQNHVPEWLISDVMMPQLSGVELAIRIREMCTQCKVLLFSGQAATVDLLKGAREQGYNLQVLAKPVHPSDLLQQTRVRSDSPPPSHTRVGSVQPWS